MTCTLDDIVAVHLQPVRYEVNHRGDPLSRMTTEKPVFDHYKCDKHDCTFRQWRAVLSHVGQPAVESAQDILGTSACRFCGCTDNAACEGGCYWASEEQILAVNLDPNEGDVCSQCVQKRTQPDIDAQLTDILYRASKAKTGADLAPLVAEAKNVITGGENG